MRLVIDELTVRFRDRSILDRASFSVRSPALIAVLGPSGSGKTSLLSAVAGSLVPTSGSVHMEFDSDESSRIDWIVQSSPLLNRRTALANVMLGALSVGFDTAEARQRASSALGSLGLSASVATIASRLSGGERQRVAVARALASRSTVLLADEPTASLDPLSRSAVCDALDEARDQGRLVLVATHDPYVASRCDSSVSIVRGKICAD